MAGRLVTAFLQVRRAASERFVRLWGSREAAGAVEFAFLAPVLIAVYLSSFEITVSLNLARKVSGTAATVTDIVARQSSVDKAFLQTMIDASYANLAPYQPQSLALKVTGIAIDATSRPTVSWSWDQAGARPYTVGSVVGDMPAEIIKPNTFVVRAELAVPHTMMLYLSSLLGTDARSMTISREYYFRQRLGAEIACTDC